MNSPQVQSMKNYNAFMIIVSNEFFHFCNGFDF